MKKTSAILLTIMILAAFIRNQTRVDNPKQPLSKNAGRIINLEEVHRIRDDGKTAVFGSPWQLSASPDGSLYFLDFAGGPCLFRYGPDACLIFRILKDGQGPGECSEPVCYFIADDTIRVAAWIPPKIIDFGSNGRFIEEAKVTEDMHGLWFLRVVAGKIYGIRNELFSAGYFRRTGTLSVPNSVYEISSDFKSWKKLYEFPVRMELNNKGQAIYKDMIDAAVRGSTLYVLHSADYQITEFDLGAARAERIIARAYDRPKAKQKHAEAAFDITEIHAVGENLWVFTSSRKPGGDDQQVDVFDPTGRFIDSFYLRFPSNSLNRQRTEAKGVIIDDGYLFFVEQEEDGQISIGKYKISEKMPASGTGIEND